MSNETTFAKKVNKNNIKALFPEGIETITISKNDYDRLYGQLSYENMILQSKIDKAIKSLEYYNSGEALYYVPIQAIIDILKENK